MRVLLHTCCAPCLAHPLEELRSEGHEVTAFFFNPNIHPYAEYLRRLDAFTTFVRDNHVRSISPEDPTGMVEWLRQVVFREAERCRVCHHMRLAVTARVAESRHFDAFSTTLLYSRFQKHDLLQTLGEALAQEYKVQFLYRDWRKGWNRGVKLYRTTGLYRQKYCGCIYSEKERSEKIL